MTTSLTPPGGVSVPLYAIGAITKISFEIFRMIITANQKAIQFSTVSPFHNQIRKTQIFRKFLKFPPLLNIMKPVSKLAYQKNFEIAMII